MRLFGLFFSLAFMHIPMAFAEFVCKEHVFLNASEEEVSSEYPDMTEVSIFAVLSQPLRYDGKAISVRALLMRIDSFYVLVPPDAPSAKHIAVSSVRVYAPTSSEDCFLARNENRLVMLRGKFEYENYGPRMKDIYYMARLLRQPMELE